jgi:hypothetical protein
VATPQGYEDQDDDDDNEEEDGSYADEEYGKKKVYRKKKQPSASTSAPKPKGTLPLATLFFVTQSFMLTSQCPHVTRLQTLTRNTALAPRRRKRLDRLGMRFVCPVEVARFPTISMTSRTLASSKTRILTLVTMLTPTSNIKRKTKLKQYSATPVMKVVNMTVKTYGLTMSYVSQRI